MCINYNTTSVWLLRYQRAEWLGIIDVGSEQWVKHCLVYFSFQPEEGFVSNWEIMSQSGCQIVVVGPWQYIWVKISDRYKPIGYSLSRLRRTQLKQISQILAKFQVPAALPQRCHVTWTRRTCSLLAASDLCSFTWRPCSISSMLLCSLFVYSRFEGLIVYLLIE